MYATGQVLLKYAAVSLAYCEVRLIILLPLINREWGHHSRPSDKGAEKNGNYLEIFGNIMPKKVTIMGKKRQIMPKFLKLTKMSSWLFPTYKIYVNILLRILVLYDMFDILLPFMDRYFSIQRSFSIVFVVEFVWSLVTSH